MINIEGRDRVVISNVFPQVEEGLFPIKRVVGDEVQVQADIFTDGHSYISANLLFRSDQQNDWISLPMSPGDNDRWKGQFHVGSIGLYYYTIQAWVDYFHTWQKDLQKKRNANLNVSVDLQIGLKMIREALNYKENEILRKYLTEIETTQDISTAVNLAIDQRLYLLMRSCYPNQRWITTFNKELKVVVDPIKARFSSWYEMFPRSSSSDPSRSGNFQDCQKLLPYIAEMGFDVLYFPPIHPIGKSGRKGKNNTLKAYESDLGSPWGIGNQKEGHKSIHPDLGSIEELEQLIVMAKEFGIDIALDVAFQCSLDHPYLTGHPDWFRWRPDHTIQHAENPPKVYEDIIPFNFETEEWKELWIELKSIFMYWIEKGIRIFRVDNPHTKPFALWEWLITDIKQQYPDIIFLSEAFTRPKVMFWLSKLGFSQSYTYFAWRHTKNELTEYVKELTKGSIKEYFRPNFWPNTPDILTEELQHGNRATFISRFVLAATLSSNYGIYGPAFELMVTESMNGSEEYLNSEKYESRYWERGHSNSLFSFIKKINAIRKHHHALQLTDNILFLEVDNEQLLYYGKFTPDRSNNLLILVNLDSFNTQTGTLEIPLKEMGIDAGHSYKVHELISGCYYLWEGNTQQVTLDPHEMPVCIFRIQKRIRREGDFEYFT